MGQFVRSDTSIDALFSKFALEPEETKKDKEKTEEDVEKNKLKSENETK